MSVDGLTYFVLSSDSGHGGQTKDVDGDEADGFDEVIYPVDFKQAGHIVDDVRSMNCVIQGRAPQLTLPL